MELSDYIRILKAHWLGVVAFIIAGVVAGGVWAQLQPKVYTATGSAILVAKSSQEISSLLVADNFTKSRAKSYLDIAKSRKVAEYASDKLGLESSPDALLNSVRVTNPIDTAVLRVSANGATPAEARDLAEAWIEGMTDVVREIEGVSATETSAVRLETLDSAILPGAPSSPNVRLSLIMGLVAGAALGFAYAITRSALDRRLSSAEVIEKQFKLPVIGVLPFDGGIAKSGVGKAQPDFAMTEAVRQLRTNLQFMDIDNPPRVLVVTSSLPGDGKSTVTVKLAEAVAESGQDVIIVDADLRRPAIATYLGLVPGVGLTDVLVGRARLEDVVQSYGNSGRLFVLGAGAVPPNPSELLGSQTMKALLDRLSEKAMVIVDTPPLIPVTDAAILTARTDGAIVVTRAGKTTIEMLTTSLANLERVNGRALGIIYGGVKRQGGKKKYYGYEYQPRPEVLPHGAEGKSLFSRTK